MSSSRASNDERKAASRSRYVVDNERQHSHENVHVLRSVIKAVPVSDAVDVDNVFERLQQVDV
jgi:hypothetical protein